jgi:hypothetical protein
MPFQITEFDYGQAIQSIARMVGHPLPTDPAGSLDPAVQQMGWAVNHALGELLAMKEWQDLTLSGTIPIVADLAGQKEKGFPLPVDFVRFIDQTQWSPNSLLPAPGPVSPQNWMLAMIQSVVPAMYLYWQIRNDQLFILAPPFPTPVNFNFFYLSRGQVIDQDDPTILKNVASKNGDKFRLDGYLIMLLGRTKYLEWKGFDASGAMRDFQIAFDSRAGSDKAAPVLTLGGSGGIPLIGGGNLPLTGYGS